MFRCEFVVEVLFCGGANSRRWELPVACETDVVLDRMILEGVQGGSCSRPGGPICAGLKKCSAALKLEPNDEVTPQVP